jgi:hypothetical protein
LSVRCLRRDVRLLVSTSDPFESSPIKPDSIVAHRGAYRLVRGNRRDWNGRCATAPNGGQPS